MADDLYIVLPPLLILAGIAGVVVPVLPGMLLVVSGMFVWALGESSVLGWVLLGLAVLVAAVGAILQYLVPGKRMRDQGVRNSTIALAVVLAVVGFFVVPVIGAVLGFVGGIWLVESGRGAGRAEAWTRTKHAVVGVLQGWGIELAAALVIGGLYVVGLLVT